MIGLYVSIITFNWMAYKFNKIMNINQLVHIWTFTISFQLLFDLVIDYKYQGYWYFTKDVDWVGIPVYILLIPPVNIMVINLFPFHSSLFRKIIYILLLDVLFLIYEKITLLPEPWGYFHHGWWEIYYDAMINPILLCILLGYYKWIRNIEHHRKSG